MSFFLRVRSLALALTFAVTAISATLAGRLAWADTIYSSTNLDIEASAPIDVGTTPLKAITLTVVGKNGYIPIGFDSSKSDFEVPGTGITTTGSFYNIYQHDADGATTKTPTLSMQPDYFSLTSTELSLDTHFLVHDLVTDPLQNVNASGAPTETKTSTSTIESPYGFLTNKLSGTFSLLGLPTSSSWDIAYLVVPNNTVIHLDFEIVSVLDTDYVPTNVDVLLTVPEPGTLVLLLSGGIGLMFCLWRTRKQ
jgi:hypothetical protein